MNAEKGWVASPKADFPALLLSGHDTPKIRVHLCPFVVSQRMKTAERVA